jgi:ABC-type sugar transport system substrate-binding protein
MNSKEKKVLNLRMLTKRVQRDLIDRRSFIKGAVALGVTASTAMFLYQAYEDGPNGLGAALAQEPNLVRKLWPLEEMALDTYSMWERTEGKSLVNLSRLAAHPYHVHQDIVWKAECEEAGVSYTVVDSALDPAKEIENMDLAIARKFDVVMGGPLDPAAASPAIKRMRQAGQIYLNFDTDSLQRPTLKHGRIWWDDGWQAAKWLGENLPQGSKVVGGVGELGTTAGNGRKNGFVDGAAEFGLDLIYFEDNNGWVEESGYTTGRPILQRLSDIQGVFYGNDTASMGFSKAARDLGRREEMLIVGADGLREGQEAVADGRLDASVMMKIGHGPESILVADYAFALVRANLHGDAMESAHLIEVITADKGNIADQWQAPV